MEFSSKPWFPDVKNIVYSKYVLKVRGSPSNGLYMKRIEKDGRSLLTSPRLLELVFRLIDIILCVNNLSTLLLLTIVKPYLSTNKPLHYIT